MPTIIFTFFLAGAIQLLSGPLKIGRYINSIPHPVFTGFMNGVVVIIIVLQLKHIFGFDPAAAGVDPESMKDVIGILNHAPIMLQSVNW